jgi:hypothetical protein
MPFTDEKHVITGRVVVVWDGITKPEEKTNEAGNVGYSHNIRVAIANDSPGLEEVRTLMQNALNESKWKGKLPAGGGDGFMDADAEKLGEELEGYTCFTAATRRGCPPIVDKHGKELNAMQSGRSFYPGAIVSLLVHAYDYDNKQKGIAFGLDGIQVLDTTTKALRIGGGISASAVISAFGGTPGAAASATGGAFTMTDKAESTRAEYHAAGWTDEMLIEGEYMLAPVKAKTPPPPPNKVKPAAPPPPAAKAKTPPPPSKGVKPHTAILAGAPAHVMLPAADGATYEDLIALGWTDETLIEHEMMEAPKKAAPPPPGKKPPAPPPKKAAGPTMTADAPNSYEEMIEAGWDDDGLVAAGFMEPA